MIAFIFKTETFLFIWKSLFSHLQAVCSKSLMRSLHVQTILMSSFKDLIKIYTLTSSSDDFPLADRADPAAHDYSEYIFPRDNLFLEKLDSDTFNLKIDLIIPDFFIFSYLLAIYYVFQWKSFLECLLCN